MSFYLLHVFVIFLVIASQLAEENRQTVGLHGRTRRSERNGPALNEELLRDTRGEELRFSPG